MIERVVARDRRQCRLFIPWPEFSRAVNLARRLGVPHNGFKLHRPLLARASDSQLVQDRTPAVPLAFFLRHGDRQASRHPRPPDPPPVRCPCRSLDCASLCRSARGGTTDDQPFQRDLTDMLAHHGKNQFVSAENLRMVIRGGRSVRPPGRYATFSPVAETCGNRET